MGNQIPGDTELELSTNLLVEETNELIDRLGVDTRKAEEPPYGSGRYRRVYLAYDRLTQAQRVFTNPKIAIWKIVARDGHSGDFLMQRVGDLLRELESVGEGPSKR